MLLTLIQYSIVKTEKRTSKEVKIINEQKRIMKHKIEDDGLLNEGAKIFKIIVCQRINNFFF